MKGRGPSDRDRREEAIARFAAAQHGVVTRAQLLEAGLSGKAVDRRVMAKRLRVLHRGVYLCGALPVPRTRGMAAVLACGPAAALSHGTAVAWWELSGRATAGGPGKGGQEPVDVAVRRGDRRPRGIRIHRLHDLRPGEVTKLDGVPITTPARTLYDMAATVGDRELERALAEGLARRLVRRPQLGRVLHGREGRPGARRLLELIEGGREPARTRSEPEERVLAMVRRSGMPEPETNVRIAGYEVDFLWRRERLVLEADGRATHAIARGFARDRSRDRDLVAAGLRVMRVTWHQIVNEPEVLLVRLAQALARTA